MTRALVAIAVLAATAGPASAAPPPLGVAWKHAHGCSGAGRIAVMRDTIAFVSGDHLDRVDRATGKDAKSFALASSHAAIVATPTGAIVTSDKTSVTALDAATGKTRWTYSAKDALAAAAGADVAISHVHDRTRTTALLDGATGKVRWTVDDAGAGGPLANMFAGTAHVFTVDSDVRYRTRRVRAFALADGKLAWSVDLDDSYSFAMTGDDVVAAGPELRILAGATGKIAKPVAGYASWVASHGARAYTMVSVSGADNKLVALDAGAVAWSVPVPGGRDLLGATARGPLLLEGRNSLRLHDAGTGAALGSLEVANLHDIVTTDGAPLAVACDGDNLVALDDAKPGDTADEVATITGTIHCSNCDPGERFPVEADGATTTSDEHGQFSLQVTARGAVDVVATLTDGYGPQRLGTVRLVGKKRYDLGTLDVQAPDGE